MQDGVQDTEQHPEGDAGGDGRRDEADVLGGSGEHLGVVSDGRSGNSGPGISRGDASGLEPDGPVHHRLGEQEPEGARQQATHCAGQRPPPQTAQEVASG